jgi:putative membrane-bound dehydrogenase-like protein
MLKTVGISGGMTVLVFVFALSILGCNKDKSLPPYAPAEALKTFQLPEGFKIQLVASEPLITDPVEIAFDPNGLLYVAEMEDYPAEGIPGGRIMLLEDKDGDGHYESGTCFADNLPYVTGVMPWRNGVLVTSAPHILYLQDTTGDHRADIRRIVLTGFALTNPQLRMSSMRYGLDNWIYSAYSRSGGQRGYPQFTNHGKSLRFPDNPKKDSADIYPGTDIRFRPDEFKVEPSGGMSQFGLAFDAAGNRFTVWNNIHLRHVVIDGKYPRTNPWLNISSLMSNISDHGDAAPVYSRAKNRLDLHESEMGHFTSACGHSIYTGGLFKGEYAGAAFVCEPVSNLVHADILAKGDATFFASRAKEGEEFLTSTDSWFRPVNTTVGPDGALYVVDFYRKLVEHPAWIARADEKGIYTHAGVLQESDFLEGSDRGRIYRIVPDDFEFKDHAKPSLSTDNTEAIAKALAHPNMWWRLNAQRLLVERRDTSAVPSLIKFLNSETTAETKVHALWTLEGLHHLDDDAILSALDDESPEVRKQAVLLAERRFVSKEMRDRILSMGRYEDPHVQLQIALSLSAVDAAEAFAPLNEIAQQHVADPWFQQAVLLRAGENSLQWFLAASEYKVSGNDAQIGKLEFLKKIASITGARQRPDEISELISTLDKDNRPFLQEAGLQGLHIGIRPGSSGLKLSYRGQQNLFHLITSDSRSVRNAALDLAGKITVTRSRELQLAVDRAMRLIQDTLAPADDRINAIRVLALDPGFVGAEVFDPLLDPTQAKQVQATAAHVLTRRNDERAMGLLVSHWQSYTAETRGIVETGFTGSSDRLAFLLNSLEKGEIQPSWITRSTRTRLTEHSDKKIQERAKKLFADMTTANRDELVTAFYEATTLAGDPLEGKEIFNAACSSCHQLENVGRRFGPDLLSVTNQTRINLLTMILDPNKNISPGYDGYLIETREGKTFAGILDNESASSVTMRTADGVEQVIERQKINTIRPMSESLMPEGLEGNYTKQDMADLLAYLKNVGGVKAVSNR